MMKSDFSTGTIIDGPVSRQTIATFSDVCDSNFSLHFQVLKFKTEILWINRAKRGIFLQLEHLWHFRKNWRKMSQNSPPKADDILSSAFSCRARESNPGPLEIVILQWPLHHQHTRLANGPKTCWNSLASLGEFPKILRNFS